MRWLEIFAGGGAVATGLEASGHQVEASIEIDERIAACYQANHPDTRVIVSDVRDVSIGSLPTSINAVWFSPVCKQHSEARNRSLAPRDDADIGLAALPFIDAIQPDLVIMENVKGYMRHPSFTSIIHALVVKHRYTVSMRVLNAADYGVPQHRERLIVQARRGPVAWPEQVKHPTSWYTALKDMLETLEIADLAPWQQKCWKPTYNAMLPVLVHSQYDYRTANEPAQLYIVPSDRPAMTVTASHNSTQKRLVLADGSIRRVSVRANARLQTLPDTYQLPEQIGLASEIVGNAVPCLLAQKLTAPYAERRVSA